MYLKPLQVICEPSDVDFQTYFDLEGPRTVKKKQTKKLSVGEKKVMDIYIFFWEKKKKKNNAI